MPSIWETIAITILVGGAAAYLVQRIWRTFSGAKANTGCGSGCGTCAQNRPNGELVPLDLLASPKDIRSS